VTRYPDTAADMLSVYSRRDGLVDWRACIDPEGERVEVHSSHCGMASDPITLQVIIQWLGRVTRHA